MLRLVHPPPEGNSGDPPHPGKLRLRLTSEEVRRARIAIRNIARAYGSYGCLGAVLGISGKNLERVVNSRRRDPGGVLVIRVAQAAGVTVESILTGQLNEAGRCKACGARLASGRAVPSGDAR